MKTFKLIIILIIEILFISNCKKPNDPETLNRSTGGYEIVKIFPTLGYSQDIVKKDTLCYITQGEGGLLIVNIKDPKKPEIITNINDGVRGYSQKIAIKDTVVYIAAGSYGVTVVNVANPYEPEVTASNLSMKPGINCHIMGDYLLTAISERGIKIAEISFPTNPDIRGETDTYGYAQGITTSADQTRLFVACGEMGLSIFDISDFQDGYGTYPLIGWCDTEGYAESVTISESNSLAFLSCGTAGLQIIDYSDSVNIHVAGSFDNGGYAKELIYSDSKIFMTVEESGLQVIDVKDINNPKLVGTVKTEYALGLDTDDNYIYISDEEEGLIIISKPD